MSSRKKSELNPKFVMLCVVLGIISVAMRVFHEDEIKKALLENESSFIFVDSANGLPIMPNVYPYNGFSVYLPKDQF